MISNFTLPILELRLYLDTLYSYEFYRNYQNSITCTFDSKMLNYFNA